jgi:hypothetical protein
MSIISAPRASASSQPAHGVGFVNPGQLHQATIVAQRLADTLVAVFVLKLHTPQIGGNTQMVGDEDENCLGIGRSEVVFQRRELFLLCAPGVKVFQVSDKDHLKGRHQRRRAGQVEHMKNAGLGQIEIAE